MACYTANLASGENLLCKTIKSGTIIRYLSAAAELSIQLNTISPLLDITGKRSKYVTDVLNEIKRWEQVPNRREPLTKSMINYIIKKGKSFSTNINDNLYSAIGDWLILGLQSGFRRKEWAQDKTHLSKFKDIQRNVDKSPAAFILEDFEFRGTNNRRLDNKNSKAISRATIVNVKWRYQKNNDNGQIISYTEDKNDPNFCYVKAAKRIRTRALKHKVQTNMPVAIFCDKTKKNKAIYINDFHINTVLREAAKHVYNISKKDELDKFTSHSIRVGACVLLHSQNITTEDIKFRLRWRSDSFRMYLRNVIELAERHKNAVSRAK